MCDFEINGVLVTKLRVVDLKEELEARGLSKSGKKDELIARLVSYLEANPEEASRNSLTEATEDGNSRDEMMRKWQEEREQLLRENEERRREEEERVSKAKEQAERAAMKETEERLNREKEEAERIAREKEEADRLAREKEETEKIKRNEEIAKKQEEEKIRREQEEEKIKQEEAKRREMAEKMKKQKAEEEKMKLQMIKDEEAKKKRKVEEEKKIEEEKAAKENLRLEKEKAVQAAAEQKKIPVGEEKVLMEDTVEAVSKEEETLILETAADDTLVMEIEQADLVSEEPPKEEKEDLISAEPGQVTSLRKLGGSKIDNKDQRKRGWGASKSRDDSVSISSNSLKDIVPDIAPLMDNTDPFNEREEGETNSIESDPDVAGPKIPTAIKREEPAKKKKRITLTDDDNETNFLLITNLTRPFTVNALKEMLKRTGTIQDFWIDRIKSTCCVKFDTTDQASETRMALNGVAWPAGNPKALKVCFTQEEEMKKYQDANTEVGGKASGEIGDRLTGVREWDKNKAQITEEAGERDNRRERDARKSDREVRIRDGSSDRRIPMKNLEDLFKKTTASPAIYWRPLTEQDIQRRIELRNKKIMEDKIRREMEDTKETIQKSNKLLSSGSPP